MRTLLDEHAVAVAEEAVALADGVTVGGEDAVSRAVGAGEGADQHEQAGLGQMEVGEQGADEAEVEAGRDEDVGDAGVGLEWPPSCVLSAAASSVRTTVVPTATMRGTARGGVDERRRPAGEMV